MTEKELSGIYDIEKRLQKLKSEIAELDFKIGTAGSAANGMPHGTGILKPVEALVIKKLDLCDKLYAEEISRIKEEVKIRNYISAVDDEEIKLIMEFRFIYLMRWQDIGKEIKLDRTAVMKKLRRYLKNHSADTFSAES